MGYSISWMAIKNKTVSDLQDDLGLSPTGEREDFPESDISAADLPNGWCHIQLNDFESPLTTSGTLKSLSMRSQIIACFIEEHVMYSRSVCWENGRQIWSIEHDSQRGLKHLITEGNLPSSFPEIKSKYEALQNTPDKNPMQVDYIFDIPLVVAKAITGYKHDEDNLDAEGVSYIVFSSGAKPAPEDKKPWWKVW